MAVAYLWQTRPHNSKNSLWRVNKLGDVECGLTRECESLGSDIYRRSSHLVAGLPPQTLLGTPKNGWESWKSMPRGPDLRRREQQLLWGGKSQQWPSPSSPLLKKKIASSCRSGEATNIVTFTHWHKPTMKGTKKKKSLFPEGRGRNMSWTQN